MSACSAAVAPAYDQSINLVLRSAGSHSSPFLPYVEEKNSLGPGTGDGEMPLLASAVPGLGVGLDQGLAAGLGFGLGLGLDGASLGLGEGDFGGDAEGLGEDV